MPVHWHLLHPKRPRTASLNALLLRLSRGVGGWGGVKSQPHARAGLAARRVLTIGRKKTAKTALRHRKKLGCAAMSSVALIGVGVLLASLSWARAGRELGGEAPPKPETYVSGYEIVRTNHHDINAFTQGLAFGPDGTLYESDGLYRHSAIREVDIETGRSRKSFANPSNIFGEGLVVHGNKLIQLSWKEHIIHELSLPDLKLIRSVHKVIGAEGWGLTSDGARLYVTDSGHELFHVDPDTYEVQRRMPIVDRRLGGAAGQRVHGVNELEWVEGELWGNVYPMYQGKASECIVRINATSGDVLGWIDMRGLLAKQIGARGAPQSLVLNGIAYHAPSRRLYVTGKKWDYMYQVRITPRPEAGPSDVKNGCQLGLTPHHLRE
jgi:glutamine cyclotransferase